LHHQRRDRRYERHLGDPFAAVTADVASHLAAPGRETDEYRIAQVEPVDQRRQVVGVRVHLVAVPRLGRPTMTTAVVGDAAVVWEAKNGICASQLSAFNGQPWLSTIG
jgi:hypothetical protein